MPTSNRSANHPGDIEIGLTREKCHAARPSRDRWVWLPGASEFPATSLLVRWSCRRAEHGCVHVEVGQQQKNRDRDCLLEAELAQQIGDTEQNDHQYRVNQSILSRPDDQHEREDQRDHDHGPYRRPAG